MDFLFLSGIFAPSLGLPVSLRLPHTSVPSGRMVRYYYSSVANGTTYKSMCRSYVCYTPGGLRTVTTRWRTARNPDSMSSTSTHVYLSQSESREMVVKRLFLYIRDSGHWTGSSVSNIPRLTLKLRSKETEHQVTRRPELPVRTRVRRTVHQVPQASSTD